MWTSVFLVSGTFELFATKAKQCRFKILISHLGVVFLKFLLHTSFSAQNFDEKTCNTMHRFRPCLVVHLQVKNKKSVALAEHHRFMLHDDVFTLSDRSSMIPSFDNRQLYWPKPNVCLLEPRTLLCHTNRSLVR